MARFDKSIYNNLKHEAIQNGSAEVTVTLPDATLIPAFKKFILNCKNRDEEKHILGRLSFNIQESEPIVVVGLDSAVPTLTLTRGHSNE